MTQLPRLNSRQAKFAANLAVGLSATAAYINAGYSKNGAGQSAGKLLKNTEVQATVRGLRGQIENATIEAAIDSRDDRIRRYRQMLLRLWRVVEERSADPSMVDIPGGRSGFLTKQIKILGAGPSQKTVEEYTVDVGLSREIRAVLEQASKELGQWTEKREVTGKDGGALSIEILDGWLAESEGSA